MTRQERLLREQDYLEFVESWRVEQRNCAHGFVPARMLFVTGLTLWELAQDGRIVGNGEGWRPAYG